MTTLSSSIGWSPKNSAFIRLHSSLDGPWEAFKHSSGEQVIQTWWNELPLRRCCKDLASNVCRLEGMKAALIAAVGSNTSKLDQLTSADMRAVGRVYAGWGVSQAFYRKEIYRELGFDALANFVAGFGRKALCRWIRTMSWPCYGQGSMQILVQTLL